MSRSAEYGRLLSRIVKGHRPRPRRWWPWGDSRAGVRWQSTPGHRARPGEPSSVRLRLEQLEPRCLLSVQWIDQGPGPIRYGQCAASPDSQVTGAVEALAAHPTDANTVYAGTVAGGVWKTTNFLAERPTWVPLTDQRPSLAIGALAFSPLDPSHQTLFAGTGNFISGGSNGRAVGILRTSDGGANWQPLAQATFDGRSIRSIVPTSLGGDLQHQVVLVAAEGGGGVYRSMNGGVTFTQLSGTTLPAGSASHLVGDPGDPTRFFAAIPGHGIYRSTNGGQGWTPVVAGIPDIGVATRIELAVSAAPGNTVYAALLDAVGGAGSTGYLRAVYYSLDHGTSWTAMPDIPEINPGGQGDVHFSILADPTDPNLIYIGGDSGGGSSGALGNLHRVWTSGARAGLGQFLALSYPHADSRDMVFLAGNIGITEADDGGVYFLANPSTFGDYWTSKSNNLGVTEFYSVAYDHLSNRIIGGTQDTAVVEQTMPGSWVWEPYGAGDGGTVDVGYFTDDGEPYSVRYSMGNNFSRFSVRSFDADGDFEEGGRALLMGLSADDASFGGFRVFPFVVNRFAPHRVLIGGLTSLYETTDFGSFVTVLNPSGPNGPGALAYGGMLANLPNEDVLYAGFPGTVWYRSEPGPLLPTNYNVPPPAPEPARGEPRDIVMDPDDWRRVYVVSGTRVYRSTDAGATWTTIGSTAAGGNLFGLTDELYCVELYNPPARSAGDEVVLVGGRHGVFRTFNPNAGAAATWSELGTNLPNAPVSDLRYDATDDVLLAGTHGRGAWTVAPASEAFRPDLTGSWCDIPAQINWGQQFSVSARVRNSGDAPTTGPYTQSFRLSNDLTWGDEDDWDLGAVVRTDIIAPYTSGVSFPASLALPANAPAGYSGSGPFYIGMVTDENHAIAETNEDNNAPPAGGLHVDYDTFTMPTADLWGLDSNVVEYTLEWGEPFTFRGRVANGGTLPVTTDFKQQFFLSPDEVWGNGNEVFLGQYVHATDVPVGQGAWFEATLTLPDTPPSGFSGTGPFYIGMTTDAQNQVWELNEANNLPGFMGLGKDYDAFVVPGYYDLAGQDCLLPARINWGETFTIDWRVRNRGNLPLTTDFNQQFFLDSDGVWGSGPMRILGEWVHTDDVPANGIGPWHGVQLTLPEVAPLGFEGDGPFYIGMSTDAPSQIVERNEADNFPGSYGFLYDYDRFSLHNNDDFAYRVDLGSAVSATDSASNVGYTAEPGEPDERVIGARVEPITSAWWSWTAPRDGLLTIDTFGSDFDTYLSLWTGDAVNNLAFVAANDDHGNVAQSRIVCSATAGTQYQIAVDGYADLTGHITLNLDFASNDDFAHRVDLGSVRSAAVSGGNRAYTGENGEPAQSGAVHSAWWSWTAPADGELTVNTFGSNFDTYLTLATGPAVDALAVMVQNDDYRGPQSRILSAVTAGTQYQIAVDGKQSATGNIALNLSFRSGIPNLAPYQPSGWPDKIVVSSQPGSHSDDGLLFDTIYVDWAVINDGAGLAAAPFWNRVYVDGSLRIEDLVNETLYPGAYMTREDLAISGLSPGQHTIKIVTDAAGALSESDEGDNEYTKSISLSGPPLPNLTLYKSCGFASKIIVSSQPGTDWDDAVLFDPLYVDWAIINDGEATAPVPFWNRVYVDGSLRFEDLVDVALAPGQRASREDLAISGLTPGRHTITIVADFSGMVLEANEEDNEYTRTVFVSDPTMPNLTLHQRDGWAGKIVVSNQPGTHTDDGPLLATELFYVDWSVINNGGVAAPAPFWTRVYVDDVVRFEDLVDVSLQPGAYLSREDVAFGIGGLAPGEHMIKIVADAFGMVSENNETDNEYTETVLFSAANLPNLTPYQPAGWSDRIVVSNRPGTHADDPLFQTDTLYVDWALINNDIGGTGVAYFVELYLDGVLCGSWEPAMLGPGASWGLDDFAIGARIPGQHTLRIVVDSTSAISESNEADNEYTKTIFITPQPLPNLAPYLPDGWPDAIVVSTQTGTHTDDLVLEGNSLYVDVALINDGMIGTGCGFDVDVYLDDVRVSIGKQSVLQAGAWRVLEDIALGPLTPGPHSLRIVLDPGGEVTEGSEDDNEYTKVFPVSAVPNLTPYRPAGWPDKIVVSREPGTHTDDSPLYAADRLYVDWAVINNGSEIASEGFVTEVYLDGVSLGAFAGPQLAPGEYDSVLDCNLDGLSVGLHTLRMVTDSAGLLVESNEADNEYQRTFTVVEPLQSSITVVEDSVPDHPQDFGFQGPLDAFLLDDDTDPALPRLRVFGPLDPNPYLVVQDEVADWELSEIVVTGDLDSGSFVDVASRKAILDLDLGENLTVTFVNRRVNAPLRVWTGASILSAGDWNDLWSNRFNWQGDVAPLPGDRLEFPEVAWQKSLHNDFVGASFGGITFSGGGYSISPLAPGTVTGLMGGIINASTASADNTVGFDIWQDGVQVIRNDRPDHKLAVTGSVDTNGCALILVGAGPIELGSGSSAMIGAGELAKYGTGTATLFGNNTYTNGTYVSEGTLVVASVDALPPGGSLTIGSEDFEGVVATVVLASGLSAGGANLAPAASGAAPAAEVTARGATCTYVEQTIDTTRLVTNPVLPVLRAATLDQLAPVTTTMQVLPEVAPMITGSVRVARAGGKATISQPPSRSEFAGNAGLAAVPALILPTQVEAYDAVFQSAIPRSRSDLAWIWAFEGAWGRKHLPKKNVEALFAVDQVLASLPR